MISYSQKKRVRKRRVLMVVNDRRLIASVGSALSKINANNTTSWGAPFPLNL